MGLRAFKYQRVSDDRAQGRSVREQERENDRVIEANGWECVGTLTDNDIGASRYSNKARPAWDELLARLAKGEADVLVTWEASRNTRDLQAYVELRKVCREHNVLLCYSGTVYDLNDGDDNFRAGLDILLAEQEVERTRKRVMRSTQANAELGLPHGKILFGYKRIYASGTGAFLEQVIDEDQAAIVREAFRRKLAGERDQWIVNDFIARGLTTGRGAQWSLTQIKRLLTNPGYAGLRVHRGEVIGKAVWPALITEAEHHAVLASYEATKQGRRHDGAIRHLLSGKEIMTCGVCGGAMGVLHPRGYYTYSCRDHHCTARNQCALDQLITDLVIARLSRSDILSALAVDNEPVLTAIDELEALRTRLRGFYDAAAAGDLTAQALARIEARLLPQIEELEARSRQIKAPKAVHDMLADPATVWEQLHIIEKREVIRTLMRIKVHKTRRGERYLNPERIEIQWRV